MSPRPADPYGQDILSVPSPARAKAAWAPVEALTGLAVVHRASGQKGRVVAVEAGAVTVKGELGGERVFRLTPGAFAVEGQAVTLVPPRAAPTTGPRTR